MLFQRAKAISHLMENQADISPRWLGCAFEGAVARVGTFSRYPRMGIYVGGGSSHSWLWFVEVFERQGLWDLCFLDEDDLKAGALGDVNALAVSGGDTFGLAGSLGREGAAALKGFIEGGGVYLGSCAGAYLPMSSSKNPLNLFNFVDVKIANLTKALPPALRLKDKFSTPYGCQYVFHPIREEVCLGIDQHSHLSTMQFITAPLYGGPAMLPGESCRVIARYHAFTEKTVFLTEDEMCRNTLLDKAAVVRCPLGRGCIYLFGPHLEHPCYLEANRMVGEILALETGVELKNWSRSREKRAGRIPLKKSSMGDLRGELSNARIVAAGMEFLPVRWTIGAKVYEPEKICVFLEAMWRRISLLQESGFIPAEMGELLSLARYTTRLLREIKAAVDKGGQSDFLAGELFCVLREYAASFLSGYFQALKSMDKQQGCLAPSGVKRLSRGFA